MITDHPRYRAFMDFSYTLKYLYLVTIGEAVRLTGGVFDAVEEGIKE